MLGGPRARVEVFTRPLFCGMKSVSQAIGALPATSIAVGWKNAHKAPLTNFMGCGDVTPTVRKVWAFIVLFNGVRVPRLLTKDGGREIRPGILCQTLDCGRHQGLKNSKQDGSVRT